MSKYAVIIAAAGESRRFAKGDKKQFAKIDNRPLFIRALESFVNRDDVCQVILAVAPQDTEAIKEKYGANLGFMGVSLAEGGAQRWETVGNALQTVKEDAEYIAVHDAVRVCVTQTMIDQVFAEAVKSGAAILAAPLTGTMKSVSAEQVIEKTVSRSGLYEAQTPQVFRKDVIVKAYESLPADTEATDDAEVVGLSGHAVTVVNSDLSNLKITYPGDMALASAILKSRPRPKAAAKLGAFEEAQW